MITGEIHISTTWAASTSFIPFDIGAWNALDTLQGGRQNRGFFATTAYVYGVWEDQIYEDDYLKYLTDHSHIKNKNGGNLGLEGYGQKFMRGQNEPVMGLGGPFTKTGKAFRPGSVLEVKIRKLKAQKLSIDRSGIQVNRKLVKGNKIVFRYLAQGDIVRP